jgi:hypothetical protein
VPFYGPNRRPSDTVADFLLGGHRKRLIVERLAADRGWAAAELVKNLRVGRATVFEVIRALNAAGALDALPCARYRLSKTTPLGQALRKLVAALASGGGRKLARPPRPGRSAGSSTRRAASRRR